VARNSLKFALICSFLAVSPTPAYSAGIPVIDGTSVTLALRKLVTDVKSWARDEALQRTGMKGAIDIAENREANDTNIAANTIVRITDALEETHNQAMDAQITPSFMACNNVSVSRARETASESARDESARSMAGYWNEELSPTGRSSSAYQKERNEQLADKMTQINSALQGTGKEQGFSRADVFARTGAYSNDLVYSEPEIEASELFIELLVGPYSERARLLMGQDGFEELTESQRIELSRATIRKGDLRSVLEQIRADYIPDENGNSLALAREDFIVSSRFSNDEWHKKITCTSYVADPSNCANDSVVLKEIAVMMGQELDLSNEMLKQKKSTNLLLSLIAAKGSE